MHGLDTGSSDLDSLGFALGIRVGIDFRQTLSVGVVFAHARVDGVAITAAARALLGGCAVGNVAIDWVTWTLLCLGCCGTWTSRERGSSVFTEALVALVGAPICVVAAVAFVLAI